MVHSLLHQFLSGARRTVRVAALTAMALTMAVLSVCTAVATEQSMGKEPAPTEVPAISSNIATGGEHTISSEIATGGEHTISSEIAMSGQSAVTEQPASAKAVGSILERVSTVERSDGLGYVIRFHLDSRPENFHIWQPNAKLIQLALFKQGVDASDVSTGNNHSEAFEQFFYQNIDGGIGADIYLREGMYMIAEAYLDANGRDLLIGLTEASPYDLQVLTDGLYPIFWDDLVHSDDDTNQEALEETIAVTEPDRQRVPDAQTLREELAQLRLNRVVIDAGHGGRDPGAIGAGGSFEKDITLAVALQVGEYLERYLPEIEVIYTRTDDTFIPLQERGSIANRAEADLFVSIHANATRNNRHAQGTEIYFLGMERTQQALEVMKRENSVIRFEDENSRSGELTPEQMAVYELSNIGFMASSETLAGKMDDQFANRAMRRSRGVKQGRFVVLYHASMPAILVELGFITNPQEEQFLVSEYGQSIMASAIFRSIRDYKEWLEGNQP